MSRLGKKPIIIPEKVEVKIDGRKVSIKGPLGEISKNFESNSIDIISDGKIITVAPKAGGQDLSAQWGTVAAHINNMLNGVTKGFEKKLMIEGVGYKAQVTGAELVLSLGLSHTINVPIPKDLKVVVEKGTITINGADVEKVGQFSANVRAYKKPEPYKGKGIRYSDEVIKRKSGKKTAAAA